jgi:hypothetical protein
MKLKTTLTLNFTNSIFSPFRGSGGQDETKFKNNLIKSLPPPSGARGTDEINTAPITFPL